MRKLLAITAALLSLLSIPAFAHRLDEYLQATILSIDSGRINGSMRLVPGVAVSSTVIASIDTNRDGTFSQAEQQAYAQRVLHDLLLRIDGQPLVLQLHLAAVSFPSTESMRQGTGEIQIEFSANLPPGHSNRRLTFENHHQSGISVYLVNTLVPRDKSIQIAGQSRNENQSFYQLDFIQDAAAAVRPRLPSLSGLAGAFQLGLRHIAEGTDHLLFLLALLLPAHCLLPPGTGINGRQCAIASCRFSASLQPSLSDTLLLWR